MDVMTSSMFFCERTPYMPGACFNLELCRN
jgi:hypothetical protein